MSANTSFKIFTLVVLSALVYWKKLYTGWNLNNLDPSVTTQHNYTLPKDTVDVSIEKWRNLIELTNISHVSNFKKMSGQGCGFAVQIDFNGQNDKQQSFKAFFKTAYPRNYDHRDAESHYREIKACYLDKILGTRAVPPCTGYRLRYQDVRNATLQNMMYKYVQCEPARNSTNDHFIEGSVQLWQEGVYEVDGYKIFKDAHENFTILQHDRAIRSAVFIFLGQCMKSHRNYFAYDNDRYIVIDNDRCLAPDAVASLGKKKYRQKEWRKVVFEVCSFPVDLVLTIHKLTSRDLSPLNVSDRLVMALEEDELSNNDQLTTHAEVFQEIDNRVFKLAHHMKECIEKGQLTVEDGDTLFSLL